MQARYWAATALVLCAGQNYRAPEQFPQIGRLEIGDDVEIGANTTIESGCTGGPHIGRGAKIDNLVHIGHNCQIGEDVVIAAQTRALRQHHH